ncbi:MAG: hypothetical protein ACLQIB_51640 [Isosphaeraceae bacterium]
MTTPRKFLLSDAIVLVAATAIGLAVFKPYHEALGPLRWTGPIGPATRFIGLIQGSWGCLVRAFPFAMAWTLAILVLRLRRPRARWRRLIRQPGLVAGLAAVLVCAWRLAGFATMYARVFGDPGLAVFNVRFTGGIGGFVAGMPGWLVFDLDHFVNTMAMIGVAVAASWVFLLVSRQWRPERSWIDRAGRALGWFWIAILPLTCWWDFHVRF